MAGAYSSAYSSAYDIGGDEQALTGSLFTKAPSFFTGAVVYDQDLTGTLFTKAPTFPQGRMALNLAGTLFTKAPTFNAGVLTETTGFSGILFQKPPSFFTGSLNSATQGLTGVLFTKAPTFPTGGLIFAAGAGGTAQSVTDGGLRFEVWTLPQLGSFTRKYDLTRYVSSFSISDKFAEIADGRLQIAADSNGELLPLAKIDQLINVDRANHANDEGSVIRVLRGTTPVMHYITKQYDDTWSSDDPTATLSLEGMELLLDRAIVPRKDYPAVPSVEPDWIYGAQSILTNTAFDNPAVTSEVVTLEINGSAGSFKIGIDYPVGTGYVYTGPIAFNPQAQDVADAIETLKPGWDVFVTGEGSSENPFIIEVLSPAGVDIGWVTDSNLLTGIATIGVTTSGGNLATEPWTRSTQLITGLFHGSYTEFEISTEQFRSAPYSLKVDGDPPATPGAFPGAQQLISVTPGRTYRASVWVRPTQQAAFRFVIRTRDETHIASENSVLLANVWQQISIPVVAVPTHVSQIVFRIATISNLDEPPWYVDDALFAPGAEAATYGAIMTDVTTPIYANGVLTWLTRTWSDTHDSAGAVWDRDLEWSVKRGQTILQLMEYARKWNYEWRIRWDTDHFEWDLFNPTRGGTNYTGTGLAITGRSGVTSSGVVARRFPEASYYQAEGEGGQWGENEDSTMSTAWGRLEQYSANVQGLDAAGLTELADRLVDDSINRVDGLSIRLEVPTALPWAKFNPGDVLKVNLSPQRDPEHLRCVAVVVSQGAQDSVPAYDVHFSSVVYQGEAAVLQAVRVLWREFKALQAPPAIRDAIVNPPPAASGISSSTQIIPFSLPGQAFVEVGRLRLYFPLGGELLWGLVSANVAPTGASLIADVNINGASIYSDPADRPTIPAGSNVSQMSQIIATVPVMGYVTIDIDQVGSSLPGGDVVALIGAIGAGV